MYNMRRILLIWSVFIIMDLVQAHNVNEDGKYDTATSQPFERGEEIHPAPPKRVKDDPSIDRLIDWSIRQGANISNIHIIDTIQHGRSIVASTDLSINDTIISLPFDMLITSQWIIEHSLIRHWLTSNTHATDAFTLYLAANRADNQSLHRAFIESLPDFVPLPLFYSQHLIDGIKNTTLEQFAHSRRRVAYSTYAKLEDDVKRHVSKADWMWALSIVWSRSFGAAKRSQSTNQWKSIAALAPLVDFLNTGQPHDINVKCSTAQQGKTFACTTTKHVKKGDELLVSYGKRSNSQLLHDYGFAMFTPVNDVALFQLPAPKSHRVAGDDSNVLHRKRDIQDALSRAGKKDKSLIFTLRAPSILNASSFDPNQSLSVVVPDETFGWARLCVIDQDDVEDLEGHEMIARVESGDMFSANNELRALRLINQSIQTALAQFPQTIEEDLEQLNGAELARTNAALYWITLMRFYEKSILVDVAALIDEKLPELALESVKESAARQRARARRQKEQEEKKARDNARKLERERLRRKEEDRSEDDEMDEMDEEEDEIEHQANNSAAWKHREL